MTYATKLDEQISAIVNGGFRDPLGDLAVVRMAKTLDNEVQCWHLSTGGVFRLEFSDGSKATYDTCGD